MNDINQIRQHLISEQADEQLSCAEIGREKFASFYDRTSSCDSDVC